MISCNVCNYNVLNDGEYSKHDSPRQFEMAFNEAHFCCNNIANLPKGRFLNIYDDGFDRYPLICEIRTTYKSSKKMGYKCFIFLYLN